MITRRDLDAIGLHVPAPSTGWAGEHHVTATDVFELVRDIPTAHGVWSLRCRRAGRLTWSAPLASRGAAPGVRPAVAQAVAVRVLSGLGVAVDGWDLDTGEDAVRDLDDAWRFVARRRRDAAVGV